MMRSLLCKPTFIGYDINGNTILYVHTQLLQLEQTMAQNHTYTNTHTINQSAQEWFTAWFTGNS